MPKPSKLTVVSYRDVGARVRQLRQAQDLTQTELAKLLGTTQTAISEVERGNRGLTVQQVVKLARALNTSPNEVLGESSHTQRPSSARILRRLNRLEKLPVAQQSAVLKVIDEILKAHRVPA